MEPNPAFWDQQRQARLQQLHFHDIGLVDASQRASIRDKLLQDINALASLARTFKSYVNQTNSISRLPAELMLHIFRLLAQIDPPSSNGPHTFLGWVRASHVCRSWREIMLRARDLWAHEIGPIPKAISTFIKRAGEDALLHVDVHFTELPQNLIIWSGAHSIPLERAHTIVWHITFKEDVESFLSALAGKIWPNLKELYTTQSSEEEPEEYMFPDVDPFYAPNLRKWTSHSLYIRLRAQSLVTMHLKWLMLEAAGLLEILAYAPVLEIVTVQAAMSDDPASEFHDDRMHANLPLLNRFEAHFADTTGDDLNRGLISFITFPASAKLDLSADYMDDISDFELLTTIARNVWPRPTSLSVTISRRSIIFKASESSGHKGSRTMTFGDFQCFADSKSLLIDALGPEFGMVDHLTVSFHTSFENAAQMWSLVNSMFPAVERLDVIEGEYLDDLVEIGEAFAEPPEYIFPRLHQLRIARGFLRSEKEAVLIGLDGVHELLRDRIPNGAGPDELWLEGLVEPGRDDVGANALRALVPNIHWVESLNDAEV